LDGIGVKVSNLGTITFKRIELNIGRKNVTFTKPLFVLDEKMANYYGIKYGRPFNPGRQRVSKSQNPEKVDFKNKKIIYA